MPGHQLSVLHIHGILKCLGAHCVVSVVCQAVEIVVSQFDYFASVHYLVESLVQTDDRVSDHCLTGPVCDQWMGEYAFLV